MQTADVIVIGAGINGAATAYNLVKRGIKSVVLLERQLIASGGTGRSAAIIRQHYSTEALVRIVIRSVEILHHFDEQVGGDAGFVNTGWAFLVPNDVSEGFSKNLALGQRLGVDVREVPREFINGLEPRINISDVDRCAFEPGSGYCDPHKTTHAYVQRFVELGGELRQFTAARGLVTQGRSVQGVKTDKGDIAAGVVVNAAGPWARQIAISAGVDLPIEVTREEEIIIETADYGGGPKLCFSDMTQAIYYRPDGASRTLLGRGFPKEYEHVDPDGYDQQVDASFIKEAMRRFHHRWPTLAGALAVNSYTGLYDVTPDWHPVLGKVDDVDGLVICAGFSGHGYKIGPGIGELMAEEIVDGKAHSVDISSFHLSRFDRNQLITAAYGGNRA